MTTVILPSAQDLLTLPRKSGAFHTRDPRGGTLNACEASRESAFIRERIALMPTAFIPPPLDYSASRRTYGTYVPQSR
jgi:hypothetical protein